jgi:hypothetical protein
LSIVPANHADVVTETAKRFGRLSGGLRSRF